MLSVAGLLSLTEQLLYGRVSVYVELLLLVIQPLQVKAKKTDYHHDDVKIHGDSISLRCRNTV